MVTLENENINIDEIKSEFSNLIEYVENNYSYNHGWTVDGEEVLKKLYKLSELLYGKKVEGALIPYKDE